MDIATGKAGGLSYDVAAAFQGKYYLAAFGSSTPTAAEYTVAGLTNPSGSGILARVRKIFVIPAAVMDISIGTTSIDYTVSTPTQYNQLIGGANPIAKPYAGHNAAPSIGIHRTFFAVPTTGLLIDNIDTIYIGGFHFIVVGSIVNTGLSGYIYWSEGS